MKPLRTVHELRALADIRRARRTEPERKRCEGELRLLWLSPARLLTSWRETRR